MCIAVLVCYALSSTSTRWATTLEIVFGYSFVVAMHTKLRLMFWNLIVSNAGKFYANIMFSIHNFTFSVMYHCNCWLWTMNRTYNIAMIITWNSWTFAYDIFFWGYRISIRFFGISKGFSVSQFWKFWHLHMMKERYFMGLIAHVW